MNWYIAVFKKAFEFKGRSCRAEYWYFFLFNIIAGIVLAIVDSIIGTGHIGQSGLLSSIYTLIALIPGIAVSIRRMHDTDRSGWWVLLPLIPLIGFIVFLIFAAQRGTAGNNRFGPSPSLSI